MIYAIPYVNVISLITNHCVNVPGNVLSQLAPSCGTFGPNTTRQCDVRHSRTSARKRRRPLTGLARTVRIVWPKEDVYANNFEPNVSNVVTRVNKLAGGNLATADLDLAPVIEGPSCELAKDIADTITDCDSPPKTIHSGLELKSSLCWPGVSHDVGTLQPLARCLGLRAIRALPNIVTSAEASCGPRKFGYLSELLTFMAIAFANLWEIVLTALLMSSDNAICPVSWRVGTCVVAAVRFGCETVPKHRFTRSISIFLHARYAVLYHSTPFDGRTVGPSRIDHQRASLHVQTVANHTRSTRLTFKLAAGPLHSVITTVRHSRIAQSPKGSSQTPAPLPLVWSMARHFSARLRLGKRGRALALGSLSPHTFAWGPNPFVNSSGFNHTFESGQAPDNTYPNPGNGGNMLSDSGSSLEPSYLATQDEGASLCNTADLFGEAPPGLSSAPSYAHANPQVPQHPSFPPALPVPLDGHRICEYSFNAGYNHAIASGVCMDDLTQLIPTRTPIRGWRTPHHPTAAAPFAPRRQPVNVLQPRELRNPSYGAPKEPHQPFDAPGRPTHLSYTSDEFQNPGTSRTALLVHQPPGPDTFAGPIFIDQTPLVGRNPWTQQLPHEERSIPSNDLPTQVAGAALPDLAGTIPPAPILVVPRSSEALEPSSKTCLVCERIFRRPYLLKDHMASCHSQQGQGKPYPCDYPGCTSAYTTHSNMMRHRNKRHSRVDNLTAPVPTQSADAERNFVGLGGLGVLETQNASESQYLTQILAAPPVGGSAFTGEAVSVQQSAPGSPTLSTTGLSLLDELLASAASRKGRKWARGRRR